MHGSCSPWPQLNLNCTRLALDEEGITAANIVQDPCMRVVTIHALTVHLVLCALSGPCVGAEWPNAVYQFGMAIDCR